VSSSAAGPALGACEETHGQDAHATRAFTLFELLAVLLLLGVILTLTAPALSGFFTGRKTADAAQMVLSLTQSAHSLSVSQGQLCRLNIDTASGEFWLTVQEGGAFVPAPGDAGRHVQVPQGTQVSITQLGAPPTGAPVLAAPSPAMGLGQSPFANGRVGQSKSLSHIDFYPTGRNDIATLDVAGRGRERYQVTCLCATEGFSVICPSEAK
jgi:prepilin-type N-terminal cleavage/methylation domain-containing protein